MFSQQGYLFGGLGDGGGLQLVFAGARSGKAAAGRAEGRSSSREKLPGAFGNPAPDLSVRQPRDRGDAERSAPAETGMTRRRRCKFFQAFVSGLMLGVLRRRTAGRRAGPLRRPGPICRRSPGSQWRPGRAGSVSFGDLVSLRGWARPPSTAEGRRAVRIGINTPEDMSRWSADDHPHGDRAPA